MPQRHPTLTVAHLQKEARAFAEAESQHSEPTLFGVTDGKAVGTYLEHKFQVSLLRRYSYPKGNSAKGIDFPGIDVDIKVTSVRQPQSSCPFKSARQKVYGLGYSLLIFVYLGAASRTTVAVQDFFNHDWESAVSALDGNLLILGNPPWVTNAGVAVVNGTNLPLKENFQGLRGIAARTGKANFDISEWMLIRLLRALERRPATLAMLCKTATARKFLRYAWQNDGRIAHAALYRIEAATHFGAAVDACLLFLRTGSSGASEADVYPSLDASTPMARIGLVGKELVANLQAYRELRQFEGLCPFQWRSGVKHDCAAIMELRGAADGTLENGLGERLAIEPDFVFPLLKCSDLANARTIPQRFVIVTQRFVGDDTSPIAEKAPQTWRYLQTHAGRFLARKSSIYKAAVPFALFGIGPYAFAPWKVAVSGLHRSALFHAIPPVEERPVFFDDTCYYLSFQSEAEARLVAEILNSHACQRFLSSLIFTDAKRPITVDLLQRLNLSALAHEAGYGLRWQQFQRVSYTEPVEPAQMALLMEEPPALRE